MKMSRVKYQLMTMILPLACLRLLYLTTSIILGELGSVGAVGGGGGDCFISYIYIQRHDRYYDMSGKWGEDEGGGAGECGHMTGVLNPSLSSLVPLA